MSAKQLGRVACLHFHVATLIGIGHHIEWKISFEMGVIWKFYNVDIFEEVMPGLPEMVGKHSRIVREYFPIDNAG